MWHLALVQRDLVWDHVRMRYLLDSLLESYPTAHHDDSVAEGGEYLGDINKHTAGRVDLAGRVVALVARFGVH